MPLEHLFQRRVRRADLSDISEAWDGNGPNWKNIGMTDGYNMLLIGGIPTIVVNILLLMVNIWLIYWLIYDYFMVIIWLMMV